ncbi:MAG: GDP-mannose 4,6-dehydratase [Hydrogenophaga sp.]|jgi:GDPmannose 4,6-dehydratase|uniref:GDP-mannose 4,6-dehydratase n=1 Tax=Hydrogenophaga sp. TaxID=1904254 RepID=UPI001DF0CF4E|nr:GDP-mannose 4,6-dehydratase [Hydrogenophaga sp.]MBW0171752.1 GDP-mannose 4,6-dehydratase [Hydrogenophaga sp.]MBW0184052.1 GDP-mannose 4,6-dehydratase [Hydrogenophaga sp.]
MNSALVTGISGQDGFYLLKLLAEKNYRVIGITRSLDEARSKAIHLRDQSVSLVEADFSNSQSISDVIDKYRPREIYNLAAMSSGSGMYEDPVSIGETNGMLVLRILESIRKIDSRIRLCQASSREIFGDAPPSPQDESTPINPRSPYGAAKAYADTMIRIYRSKYNLYACSAILFNHESPQRGLGFVTRKISRAAAQIRLGLASELQIGNLDAQRDWGFAGDYVRAMWLMLQQQHAEDYVISTGRAHSVRQLCELAFSHVGLDYRNYVREDLKAYRPAEPALLVGSSAKARAVLGWEPNVSFEVLIRMMVDTDMQVLNDLDLGKNGGETDVQNN